jgi:hypothetical protein
MGVKHLSQLADNLLVSGYVDLYLFLSIVFLILFTRLLGFPDTFSIALFSTISTPVMHSIAYYYRKLVTGYFVKPKDHRVVRFRAAYRSLVASLTSFVTGFIVFVALSGSTDIVMYSLAYVVTWVMRATIYFLLPVLANSIDIENPAIIMIVALAIAVLALAVIVAVTLIL